MSHRVLYFLTDFGDESVILPLLVVVVAVLLAQRRWRVGAAWLLAVSSVLGTILVLKIGFFACSWLVPSLGAGELALQSPSGHTAAASVAYGGIGALVAARSRWSEGSAALTAAMAALGVALLIGLTRVLLGAHSLSEVVVASLVGLGGAVVFVRLAGRPLAEKPVYPVLAGALLVVILFHGRHLSAETVIQGRVVDVVRHYIPLCDPL